MQILYFAPRQDVRFGSEADMCGAKGHVRFTPNSDRESGHAAMVMSALHLKADMCGETAMSAMGHKRTQGRSKISSTPSSVCPESS